MLIRGIGLSVLGVLASWRLGVCQCPDGTPPPCRGAAPARRANPPLDERTWIVVPFENQSRTPDIEWLREASVNLLYLDMSQWRDIRVIDDERVADLMREVPQVRAGQALSLDAGIAVARRAGAGKLVMGDLLKIGSRTRVVAKVFDVRTSQRVRNVIEETTHPDSLMGVFGRLARGILAAEPPGEATLGAVGTSSLAAYQEYLAGVRALNAFDLVEAHRRFEGALRLDSTFALAHYKLTIVLGWESPIAPGRPLHAAAAARLGGGLPARERALINGLVAQSQGDFFRACEIYAPMLRADSSDVEVLYNLGECAYHDNGVVPLDGDSPRFRFRTSWNTALWAFRRVLALDPSYHLAFQHIGDALQASSRSGCLAAGGRLACGDQGQDVFAAAVRRSGDSLLTVPVRQQAEAAAFGAQLAGAQADGSRRHNLEESRRAAEEWVNAGPAEPRARIAYTRALLRLGRLEEAAVSARQVTGTRMSIIEARQFAADRIEMALKTMAPQDARRLLDSIRAGQDTVLGVQALIGVTAAVLGRPGRLDTAITEGTRAGQAPPWVPAYFISEGRAILGLPDDSLLDRERVFVGFLRQARGDAATTAIAAGTLLFAMRRSSGQWPIHDTASADPRMALVSWLAVGDTARFRRALVSFDSMLEANREMPDRGGALIAAEAHLVLRDTAGALARLRTFRDVTWRVTPFALQLGQGFSQTAMLWPRTFLLLGDLAAATGARDEARLAYRQFIGMWEGGDAETRPVVERARRALAALGS